MKKTIKLLLIIIALLINNNVYALNDSKIFPQDEFTIHIEDNLKYTTGDKVYVDLTLDRYKWEDTVTLYFYSTTSDDKFEAYLKEIYSGKPYFIVPDTAKIGEKYELKHIILWTNGDNGFGYGAGPSLLTDYDTVEKNDHVFYTETDNKKFVTINEKHTPTSDEILENIKLLSFQLNDSGAYTNENVYISLKYSGEVDSAQIWLTNKETGFPYSSEIYNLNDKSYFKLEKSLIAGDYSVDRVDFCKLYNGAYYCTGFPIDKTTFTIFKSEQKDINLVEISIYTNNVKPTDKVEISINADLQISKATLFFSSDNNDKKFSVNVKNLKTNKPYFTLPTIIEDGHYNLQKIIISDNNGVSQIIEVPNYNGDTYTDENGTFYEKTYINVKSNDEKKIKKSLTFNNEDFDETISKLIKEMDSDATITVDCINSPIVSSNIFKLINETRRKLILQYGDIEWIFNGQDIVNPKNVNVSILIDAIDNSNFAKSNIYNKTKNDSLLTLIFSNNGELPGKALIRINSSELDSNFNNKKLYIYYYKNNSEILTKIALDIAKKGDYYEFYINHNSEYIISAKELNKEIVSDDDTYLKLNTAVEDKKKENEKNENHYNILLIGIIVVLIVVFIVYKSIKKNNKK